MKDLSKIDFTKCELSSPCLEAKRIGQEVAICDNSPGSNGSALAVKTSSGDWIWALQISGRKLDTCINIVSAAAKVDAFIASELAKLEPEWVEVKWTEVERLCGRGCVVQFMSSREKWETLDGQHWDESGVSGNRYQVDKKTVPAGVKLYEQEWIDVPWIDVEALQRGGARVQGKEDLIDSEFIDRLPCRYESIDKTGATKYRADRKTCPDGYGPTVGNVEAYNKGPAVGDGYQFCGKAEATEATVFNGAGWSQWAPYSHFKFDDSPHLYRFRRPVAKPKTFTVDLPDDVVFSDVTVVYCGRKYGIKTYALSWPSVDFLNAEIELRLVERRSVRAGE